MKFVPDPSPLVVGRNGVQTSTSRVGPEAFGHDTDDRVRLSFQLDRASEDLGVRSKRPRPQSMTEHGDRGSVGDVLLGCELPPHEGRDAEGAEEAGAHALLRDVPCGALRGEVHTLCPTGVHGGLEVTRLVPDPEPARPVDVGPSVQLATVRVMEGHQAEAVGLRVG